MTTPPPLETFSTELMPGESILWTGRPDPSVVFHREDWLAIPFSLMWGGFAILWLLGASGIWNWSSKPNQSFEIFGVIWGTPFVLVGQYFIWGRFVYARWKKKRTYYALTNRRALIVEHGFGGKNVSSAALDTLILVDKRVHRNGNGSISFGGPVTDEFQFGKRGRQPRFPTFFDIDGADPLYQTIQGLQDEARKAAKQQLQSRW